MNFFIIDRLIEAYALLMRNIKLVASLIYLFMSNIISTTLMSSLLRYGRLEAFGSLNQINKYILDIVAYGMTDLFFVNVYFILLYGLILKLLWAMID